MTKTYLIQITDKETSVVLDFHVTSLDNVFRMTKTLSDTHRIQVVDESNDIYFEINRIEV